MHKNKFYKKLYTLQLWTENGYTSSYASQAVYKLSTGLSIGEAVGLVMVEPSEVDIGVEALIDSGGNQGF